MRQIRIIHGLARTGGTVLSMCLGSMRDVVLLSEVNPRSAAAYHKLNPVYQAARWFSLLDAEEMAAIGEAAKRADDPDMLFVEAIDHIERAAAKRGKTLVLRDWSHVDFLGAHWDGLDMKPTDRLALADLLGSRFKLRQVATCRHPINQWRSYDRYQRANHTCLLSAADMMRGTAGFARAAAPLGFIKYEDFVSCPEAFLRGLCEKLELTFDPGYAERWRDYDKVTGDVDRPRERTAIREPAPHDIDEAEVAAIRSNPDYQRAIKLFGYQDMPA